MERRGKSTAGPDSERGDKGAAGLHADWARMSTATLWIQQEDKLTAGACTEREGNCEGRTCT